ncbi:hypothetical protein DMC30DRAFT_411931 [Rhodotorula diobovata]|uniref:PHD-type domain-containing protein n=1 Tax=Rhodotorula diobovata TaxID=5288 RepID=A0A5C5FUX3_9BASI|nr:hypothetical protein DMC30DRAFT_411931 [Rhodotorula diobovata]
MPRASSTHGTASGASTPEPSTAAAGPSHEAGAVGDPSTSDDERVDPLAQLELEAFGTDAVEEALPAPPQDPNAALRDAAAAAAGGGGGAAAAAGGAASGAAGPANGGASATLAGQGTGTKRTLAASGPMSRAKRPKNVKFSPAKTGKALARRSAAAAVVEGGPGAYQLPNHDYCDACGGKGHFLCCEGGCLRSFHFSCLEPPLELDEVPEDSWYCKTCRANINPPIESRHRFFGELITRVETENPKQFSLPQDIKGFFKNVASGVNGEFIDAVEHRPPSKITGRAIGQEDRDGFRLKDKNGRPIICYNCDGAANPTQRRRIISCDFCDQHWHLDCLDPPMTGMPPPTRKWMCPLHSDTVIPRKRQPKQTQLVNVDKPYRPNNGDIVIVPAREEPLQQDVDEMTVNRVRYQVPEQHVILDFWGRLTGQKNLPPPPSKKSKGKSPRKRPSGGYDSGDSSPLSELTSSDESGSDAERSSSRPAGTAKAAPSALDNLALLAEVRYIDYLTQQQQQQQTQPGPNGTPAKAGPGGAAPGKAPSAHDLPPALPNSTQRRPLPARGLPPTPGGGGAAGTPVGGIKRTSFTGVPVSVGVGVGVGVGSRVAAPFASPAAGAGAGPSRSRGASPSVSPAPGKLADVTVESKEDLKALGHVRKLIAAQSKLKEGDAKKAALLDYLEGALIVSVGGHGAAPWSRPWDDKPGAAGTKKPAAAAARSGSQASPPAVSPLPSAALGATLAASPSGASPAASPASAAAASPAPPASTAPPAQAASAPAATPAAGSNGAPATATTAPAGLPVSPLPFSLPASSAASAAVTAPAPVAAAGAGAAAAASDVKEEEEAGDTMDVDAAPSAAGGANGA